MSVGYEPGSHLPCKVPHTLTILDRSSQTWLHLDVGVVFKNCDARQPPLDILI